jgi:hypothetical protein
MITPEMKDRVLRALVFNAPLEKLLDIETEQLTKNIDVPSNYIEAILKQMERMGFVSEVSTRDGIDIICHIELHDFYRKGGFVAQEAIMQTQLEKMHTELLVLQKELEPDHLDKANKLSGIIQGVAGLLQFITTIKQ